MARFFAILSLSILAIGCGDNKNAPETASKPSDEDVRSSIVLYLSECGLQEVELATVAPESKIPQSANYKGEGWAYKFTASFTNVLGERKTDADWLAVLTRDAGKTKVALCLNEARKPMGGKGLDDAVNDRAALGIVAPMP